MQKAIIAGAIAIAVATTALFAAGGAKMEDHKFCFSRRRRNSIEIQPRRRER